MDEIDKNIDLQPQENNLPGQPYEIPFEGSLGLLALGAVGLKAWRNKRKEILEAQLKKEDGE